MVVALLLVHTAVRSGPQIWLKVNTDFPNYFVTARLVRAGFDASRAYEWTWIERQKDHQGVDIGMIGLVPITPFSTLMVYPLSRFSPLTAKRCWLIFNFGLLLCTVGLLRSLTGLRWRRLALVVALSVPVTVNFAFGQFYVLLLFVVTLACWLHVSERRWLAGLSVGVAAGLKVFPALYLVYFARKRDWRALAGGVLGGLGTVTVSLAVFGWELNRTYLMQVLPRTLRGEVLDPYNLQLASMAALLHRLFVFEPQMNPHPAMRAAWLFAVLHPVLQMAVLATALLGVTRGRVKLEWAAMVMASLAMSTSPASYLFTLLILPVCLLMAELEGVAALGVLALYAVAGWVSGMNQEGWGAVFGVPRLWAVLVLCGVACWLLWRKGEGGLMMRGDKAQFEEPSYSRLWLAGGFVAMVGVNLVGNLRSQRGVTEGYGSRVAMAPASLLTGFPMIDGNQIRFVTMGLGGYRVGVVGVDGVARFGGAPGVDELAVSSHSSQERDEWGTENLQWLERVGKESVGTSGTVTIVGAEMPVVSADGRWLAYLREESGRGRLWIRDLRTGFERVLASADKNVMEMTFTPHGGLVFSVAPGELWEWNGAGLRALGVGRARWPAVSPDGHWMAYSLLDGGNWNLWLQDRVNGETRRLTHAACNDMQATWAADNATLVWASDCGRGLWLTALERRRVR